MLKAWTYVTSTTACWLKRQIGSLRVSSPGRNSGVKQQIATTTANPLTTTKMGTCITEINLNYKGNDIGYRTNIPTPGDCCNLCKSTPTCQAWSYFIVYQFCYLKTAIPQSNNKEAYNGIWSGYVVG